MSRAPFLDGSVHYEETRVKKKKVTNCERVCFIVLLILGFFFLVLTTGHRAFSSYFAFTSRQKVKRTGAELSINPTQTNRENE